MPCVFRLLGWMSSARVRTSFRSLGSTSSSKEWAQILGAMPLPWRENRIFLCGSGKAAVLLLRLQGGRQRHPFVMEIEHLPFPEAVKHLADQLHMPLPQMEADPDYQRRQTQRERLLACNRDAAHFFYETLFTPRAADAGLFEAPRRIRRRHPQIWSGRSAEQLGRFNPRDAGKGLHHRRAANGWADCHQGCGGSDGGSPCAPAPRF